MTGIVIRLVSTLRISESPFELEPGTDCVHELDLAASLLPLRDNWSAMLRTLRVPGFDSEYCDGSSARTVGDGRGVADTRRPDCAKAGKIDISENKRRGIISFI